MRREDNELIGKQLIEGVLNQASAIRLAMVDEGEPYLISMNYAYEDGFLYMHSAKKGRKIDILMKNNRVAFQTDIDVELVLKEEACSCSTKYMSVFGTGTAFLIEDKEEKTKALDAIMMKHTGKTKFEYIDKIFEKTLVIKVYIESMTGKKCGY